MMCCRSVLKINSRDVLEGKSSILTCLLVSLVGNYRSQFARILHTASLDELIQNLRAKASSH